MKNLFEKHLYLNKSIDFINNSRIIEFDMRNAGLSILYHNQIVTKEQFDLLNTKENKNIIVGKFLQKNPKISEFLMQEFINIRQNFFELNDINDSDVLAIKKDAIFLINKVPRELKLNDDYEFRNKNEYVSYLQIRGNEIYYDMMHDKLDIKGFNKKVKESQKLYMFQTIKEVLHLLILGRKNDVFIKLLEFKNDYLEKNLDNEYYRDMDDGLYHFNITNRELCLPNIDDELKKIVRTENNLNFIIEFISKVI